MHSPHAQTHVTFGGDIRVLLVGTRRRIYFIDKLRKAIELRGFNAIIHGADIDELDPFVHFCDHKHMIPNQNSPLFVESILDIVSNKKIHIVIAWNDLDILRLSHVPSHKWGSCSFAAPPKDIVELMCDKERCSQWLLTNGVDSPRLITAEMNNCAYLPNVVKPRFGQGGVGVSVCKTLVAYEAAIESQNAQFIVQDYIEGDEFTVDVISNAGDLIAAAPRRRLKVRGGEVLTAQIDMRDDIIKIAARLTHLLNFSGIYNFQVILFKDVAKIIEINPRFGGGSDLSIEGGLDIPGAYIDIFVFGKAPSLPPHIKNGLIMSRYFESIFQTSEDGI